MEKTDHMIYHPTALLLQNGEINGNRKQISGDFPGIKGHGVDHV